MGGAECRHVPFCAVCREALTRCIRDLIGTDAFVFEIGFGHLYFPQRILVSHFSPGGSTHLRFQMPPAGTRRVNLKLDAGTLPLPWRLSVAVNGEAPANLDTGFYSFDGKLGDRAAYLISSDCPYAPFDVMPTYTVEFRFDRPAIPPQPPTRPVNPAVSYHSHPPNKPIVPVTLSAQATDADRAGRFQFYRSRHRGLRVDLLGAGKRRRPGKRRRLGIGRRSQVPRPLR